MKYKTRDTIKLFPMIGGWFYVGVPKTISTKLKDHAIRGLIPITAKLGKTIWETSLLPLGDGTHFIPVKKQVRAKEHVSVEDTVTVYFEPRKK